MDWFLPTTLGGLNLEETSGRGVLASGFCARRLAHLLVVRPDLQAPPTLPSGLENSERGALVAKRYKDLIKRYPPALFSPTARAVQGGTLDEDVMGYLNRSDWFSTAGLERDPSKYKFFRPNHKLKRDEKLQSALEVFSYSRARCLGKTNIKRMLKVMTPITQRMLDDFVPLVRVYPLNLPMIPRVDLSTPHLADTPKISPEIPRVLPSYDSLWSAQNMHDVALNDYSESIPDRMLVRLANLAEKNGLALGTRGLSTEELLVNRCVMDRPILRTREYERTEWDWAFEDWALHC
jgi:hypothetical protein